MKNIKRHNYEYLWEISDITAQFNVFPIRKGTNQTLEGNTM